LNFHKLIPVFLFLIVFGFVKTIQRTFYLSLKQNKSLPELMASLISVYSK